MQSTKILRRSKTPLKPNSKHVNDKGIEIIHNGDRIYYKDDSRDIDKIITFNPETFLGWASLLCYQGTVFEMKEVKFVLFTTGTLGFTVALITSRLPTFGSKDFDVTPLDNLIKFLLVFLAFMTGVFVNGAFARWQEILRQMFLVVHNVKKLCTDLAMHSVDHEVLRDIRRWGLVSVWFVALEAPATWEPPEWDEDLDDMQEDDLLTNEERAELRGKTGKKAELVWVWISLKIRELSESGAVPARQTPAFVKMLDHIHEATTAIHTIFNLILFQVPHQYLHMLAFLIHLFSILNTIKCGMRVGANLAANEHFTLNAMQGQTLFVDFLFMLLSPLIYSAFLAIASDITIPFGSGTTDIPIRFMLERFHTEFQDMDDFMQNPVRGTVLSKQSS
mmetsp:Transcript_109327/g.189729  ORF Transcript_109327/g.189729 Transcript_109327/m.189729 type:complete len:391 (-) Transcript_109327:48-1220(-)